MIMLVAGWRTHDLHRVDRVTYWYYVATLSLAGILFLMLFIDRQIHPVRRAR